MAAGDSPPRLEWPKAIGLGAYLACSWPWCIGMFLPTLFARVYGIWGFVIFAAPNVVGAAAMGWFLRLPGASESLLEQHRPATIWFSRVTIAFQIFFFAWLASGRLHIEDARAALKGLPVAVIPVVAVLCWPCVATENSSAPRGIVGCATTWGV